METPDFPYPAPYHVAEATPPRATAQARPTRTWPAVLTLAFVSPLTAEVLTGSTPILLFLTPPALLFQVAFYGSGALLIHEVVRRRGLGWPNIVVLGAAYGILEEGLVNTTWFNPYWPDVLSYHGYGRALGLNWVWALNLTTFHAIVSITIPILLVELLFPQLAARPWLGRKGLVFFIVALALASALGLWLFGFVLYRGPGYTVPPLVPYLGTLALALGLVGLGTSLRLPAPRAPSARPRRPPPLWLLRALGFGAAFAYFADEGLLQALVPFQVACAIIVASIVLIIWRIWTWSRRSGWGARHMLALASGALGLFIFVFAPVLEALGRVNSKPTRGTGLVALGFLILLIVLARRTARCATIVSPSSPVPGIAHDRAIPPGQ